MTTMTQGRRAVLAAAAMLAAACGDSPVEPLPDYDPTRTLDELNAVLDPLDTSENAFLGISLASATLSAYGAAPVAGALSAGTAALRAVVGSAPQWGERRLPDPQRLRELATSVLRGRDGATAAGPANLVLPVDIKGKTLVWDPTQGYLVSSRAGAPTNGVRLVLYQMDRSGYPAAPLTEIGFIDLIDEDRTLSERIGVWVVESVAGASSTVANYDVDLSVTGTEWEGTLDLGAAGEIGGVDGAVSFNMAQEYSWSESYDTDGLVLDYSLAAPGWPAPVMLLTEAESRFNAPSWASLRFLATFDPGAGDEVQMDVSIGVGDELAGGIWTRGRQVVEVGGVDGDPWFVRGDGRALSQSDEMALRQIWIGLADLITLGEWVMIPADVLYLDG